MRYCGTCGTLLEAGDLAAGRCPACGVAVVAGGASGGDATPADAHSVVEYFARGVETPQSLQTPAARADTPTILSGMPLPPPSTPSNPSHPAAPSNPVAPRPVAARDAARWPDVDGASWRTDRVERRGVSGALAALAVALAALALVVAVSGVLGGFRALSVLVRTDTPPAVTTPAPDAPLPSATSAAASPSPGARSTPPTAPNATPGASVTAGPTSTGTPSPASTGVPAATVPASPTDTPVPTDAPPMLAVDQTAFSFGLCTGLTPKQASLTVKNTGGGTLTWTATTANGYSITPGSGTLAAGASVSVTIMHITTSGMVTVMAEGAAGSPQTVTITCQAL
jgi:HYDIN/CFA65/VesB family protein